MKSIKINKNFEMQYILKNKFIATSFSTMQNNKKEPKINILTTLLAGIFVGFVNGFCGGGGGMICVPLLTDILGLPEKKGHATAILIMLPLCIASFVVYLLRGNIDIPLSINVGIGFVIGGIIGAIILKNINSKVLKLIFAIVILVSGVKLLL